MNHEIKTIEEFQNINGLSLTYEEYKDINSTFNGRVDFYFFKEDKGASVVIRVKAILHEQPKLKLLCNIALMELDYPMKYGRHSAATSFLKWYREHMSLNFGETSAMRNALKYAVPDDKIFDDNPGNNWLPYSRTTLALLFY